MYGFQHTHFYSKLIEDHPEVKYDPIGPVFVFMASGFPLRIHGSYPSRLLVKIITLYVAAHLDESNSM